MWRTEKIAQIFVFYQFFDMMVLDLIINILTLILLLILIIQNINFKEHQFSKDKIKKDIRQLILKLMTDMFYLMMIKFYLYLDITDVIWILLILLKDTIIFWKNCMYLLYKM